MQSLERAEVNRLFWEVEKESNPRDTVLVRLLLSCGLRLSDAVSLRVADVELERRNWMIRQK